MRGRRDGSRPPCAGAPASRRSKDRRRACQRPALPRIPPGPMTRALTVTLLAIATLALTADAPSAPQSPGGPGRRYDPSTVETISCEVLRIDHIPSRRATGTAVHLALRVKPGETVDVRL